METRLDLMMHSIEIFSHSRRFCFNVVYLCFQASKKKVPDVRSLSRSSGKARSGSETSSDSSSEDAKPNEKLGSSFPEEDFQKYNYIHFDPENHWCRVCNVFPRTAKEYLHHLHSPEHKEQITVSPLVLSNVLA